MKPSKPLFDTQGSAAEQLLEPLVEKYGLKRVLEDLGKIIPLGNFEAYCRVAALARNVSNRIERNKANR